MMILEEFPPITGHFEVKCSPRKDLLAEFFLLFRSWVGVCIDENGPLWTDAVDEEIIPVSRVAVEAIIVGL